MFMIQGLQFIFFGSKFIRNDGIYNESNYTIFWKHLVRVLNVIIIL